MSEIKAKILIADDEKRITLLVSDYLNAAGFNTVCCYDGQEALNEIKANIDIDLAILDNMMPGIDGWEATKKIREFSDIPIIMLTARSEEFDQLVGFENGADDYVTKPFSLAVLVKRIEALLRRAKGIKQSESKQQEGRTQEKRRNQAFDF